MPYLQSMLHDGKPRFLQSIQHNVEQFCCRTESCRRRAPHAEHLPDKRCLWPGAALPAPERLRAAVEAALDGRKAAAGQAAGDAAEAQAAAAAKDGELTAQRTQLHALRADLDAEEQRLQQGLARAEVVRAAVQWPYSKEKLLTTQQVQS